MAAPDVETLKTVELTQPIEIPKTEVSVNISEKKEELPNAGNIPALKTVTIEEVADEDDKTTRIDSPMTTEAPKIENGAPVKAEESQKSTSEIGSTITPEAPKIVDAESAAQV